MTDESDASSWRARAQKIGRVWVVILSLALVGLLVSGYTPEPGVHIGGVEEPDEYITMQEEVVELAVLGSVGILVMLRWYGLYRMGPTAEVGRVLREYWLTAVAAIGLFLGGVVVTGAVVVYWWPHDATTLQTYALGYGVGAMVRHGVTRLLSWRFSGVSE